MQYELLRLFSLFLRLWIKLLSRHPHDQKEENSFFSLPGFLFLFFFKMPWKLLSSVIPLFIVWDVSLNFASPTHHVFHWNRTNPLFSHSNSEINVNLEDSIDFRCPLYPSSTSSSLYEYYLVYIVTMTEYNNCRLRTPVNATLVLNCSTPNNENYFTILIRRFQSVPGMIDFPPGKYYFMTTSTGYVQGLDNKIDGACKSNKMKLAMTVSPPGSQTPSPSQAPQNSSDAVKTTTSSTTTTTTTPKPVTPSPSPTTTTTIATTQKPSTTTISTTTKFHEKPKDPSKENVIDATGTSKNTGTINSASRTLNSSKTLLLASIVIFILLLRYPPDLPAAVIGLSHEQLPLGIKLMTSFIWDVKNGQINDVQKFVEEKGADVVNKEVEGRFPLHFAADYGQSQVIEYLVSKGANINQKDKHNITPLLAAVWEGHVSSVETLLKLGADKTVTSPDGQSLIECAEKEDVKALLK
ncbi:uncharacterized protein LOC133181010 [Saccostrea echinata]|uniref:uncharacterized protein LOC133181010 n=1 Tax=Saccostrea echinata TaxID=191078 RepID=UPI002A8331BA|nr:uncharacterized protein LOC133181010 [Saccostrea echinata]